ncbi:hypothetical protein HY411_00645 [Candidatus Gottesmanbacteria bacterium]|nr:hypothetical protein [Candidatus Gottesmanbacteria bacterium]
MATSPSTPFQKTLSTLLQAIEQSVKLSHEEKEKLYERIYQQIYKVTEAVLVVHVPEEKLKALSDQPDTVTLSSYADLIISAVGDSKTAPELEVALTGLVGDIARAIRPKL